MKAKNQEINQAKIQEVEHLFFSTINGNELLFVKERMKISREPIFWLPAHLNNL